MSHLSFKDFICQTSYDDLISWIDRISERDARGVLNNIEKLKRGEEVTRTTQDTAWFYLFSCKSRLKEEIRRLQAQERRRQIVASADLHSSSKELTERIANLIIAEAPYDELQRLRALRERVRQEEARQQGPART